jgi:hypothetical protein
MTKRNLTIGLLVFFLGVMMAACGGSKSNNNAAPTTPQEENFPNDFQSENNACQNCVRTFDGEFRVLDAGLYLEAFEYQTSGNISFGGGVFDQVLGEVLNPAANVAVCAGQVFFTQAVAEFFANAFGAGNNFDATSECTVSEIDFFGTGTVDNSFDLRDRYPARVRVQYQNGRAAFVELSIASDLANSPDQEIFRFDEGNVFINDSNTLLIQNANGRVRFGTTNGRVIGEFRD